MITLPEFDVKITGAAEKIERALIECTAEMNRNPLRVNLAKVQAYCAQFLAAQVTAMKECEQIAGQSFTPNSRAECVEIFRARGHNLSRTSRKTDAPKMDKAVLQAISRKGDKLADAVIRFREAQTKLGQLTSWLESAGSGEVQCNWLQFGTPMGRYACENPSLQNRIVEIRETVEAHEGFEFLSLDLGQAEYVMWASLSKDPVLSQAFIDGTDFHTIMWDQIKAEVPNVTLTEVSGRQAGKTVNFALLYLMQDFVLAAQLGCSTESAKKLMDAWAARAPLAFAYREDVLTRARYNEETISTFFGRSRVVPGLRSPDKNVQHAARKTAWHHHNCGTASELVKIRQAKVWNGLRKNYAEKDARIALQMHDEVIIEARKELIPEIRAMATEKFLAPTKGFLPFRVDVRVGPNWRSISK